LKVGIDQVAVDYLRFIANSPKSSPFIRFVFLAVYRPARVVFPCLRYRETEMTNRQQKTLAAQNESATDEQNSEAVSTEPRPSAAQGTSNSGSACCLFHYRGRKPNLHDGLGY
jgi:hypothetical protein